MQIINHLDSLRDTISALRKTKGKIALVPTMGALHAGHMALVEAAKARGGAVVVSIFVNPTQFGPNEDLDAYPRTLEKDVEMLNAAGVDLVWVPPVSLVYPDGFATKIHVEGPSVGYCGGARPGHFDGVALIVSKLFNQSGADAAFFGEKDFQQLAVIRQVALDLDFDIEIVGVPIVRDADGLALSSRNAYLNVDERAIAPALPRALQKAANEIRNGAAVSPILAGASAELLLAGFNNVDYFELADSRTLAKMDSFDGRQAHLLAAARVGKTRLIDNLAL